MIKENLSKYKEEFKKCIEDLKHKETFYRQIPNLITISRPLGMIPANILFFTGNTIPALILTVLLLSTDFVDGKLARKWNVESSFGADLDAIGDKIMFVGMALPIVVSNTAMMLNIMLEGIISYVNVLGRLEGLDTKTVYSGKIKAWLLSLSLVLGYMVQFLGISSMVFNISLVITYVAQALTLVDYIKRYKDMKEIKEKEEKLSIIKQLNESTKEKKKQKENTLSVKEELIKEKEFLLSTKEPDKVYDSKKRTRNVFNKKRTIN